MRRLSLFFFFSFLFISIFSGCAGGQKASANNCTAVFPDGFTVSCEIARTDEEITAGLMHRERMDADKGMLFVMPGVSTTPFWMKNTKILLGIIFLDGNFSVINVEEAEPCAQDPCPLYYPEKPYYYVLEANKGIAEAHGAGKGVWLNVSVA